MWYEVHPTPVKGEDGKNLVYVRPKSERTRPKSERTMGTGQRLAVEEEGRRHT